MLQLQLGCMVAKKFLVVPEEELYVFCGRKERTEAAGFLNKDQADEVKVSD